MSAEYGIGVVKNRFALNDFEEEEIDPLELLKQNELEKEARKKSKVADKASKPKETPKPKAIKPGKDSFPKPAAEIPAVKDDKNRQKKNEVTKKHVTIVENHNKKYTENSPEDKPSYEVNGKKEMNGNPGGFDGESRNRRGLPRGVFVRGGGRGNFRGGFPRSTFDSRGKREYDRQSGSDKTGIKPVDKRDGSGSHNWGNPRDDLNGGSPTPFTAEETINPPEKLEEEQPAENVEATATNEEGEDANASNAAAEEKKELTLDEWKALKTPKKSPSYNIRKAGEGEDLTQWKKMYALDKKRESDNEDDEYEYGEYPQRVGRQKKLDIDIRFKDARGTNVRGRGFGRGFQAGRGGGQGQGQGQYTPHQNGAPNKRNFDAPPAPKVDDEHDFPALA